MYKNFLWPLPVVLFLSFTAVCADTSTTSRVLPLHPATFKGAISKTLTDSKAAYAPFITPPPDAPNVVLILLDDVGFGHASTFGGPIPTPALDRVARDGLRYNNFYTTGMCAPTRAALLTGRNHHRTGNGPVPEGAKGFPGYDAHWGEDAASLADILRMHGYNTAMLGKWHNTPEWEAGPAGPFNRWPTGKGFEYFYGFLGGDTNQWAPTLYENTRPVAFSQRDGYTLNEDLANHAISWLRNQHSAAPEKPFFLYLATGGTHAPLQAPKEWIDRFKGQFDEGWDRQRDKTFALQQKIGVIPQDARLTPRPPEIPAWDSFTPTEQRVMARMQEVYAGYLAQTDHEVGRVLDAMRSMGLSDNTLVIYIAGDNGASAEGTPIGTINEMMTLSGLQPQMKDMLDHIDELGGPNTEPHYAAGWAWAGSTPFQYFKRIASHLGAVRNGFAVSWPRGIHDAGGLRTQFSHVVDILPTVLEAARIPLPTQVNGVQQLSYDGTSMLYSFDHPAEGSKHRTQYFEIMGTYAIYQDGWFASARRTELMPWIFRPAPERPLTEDRWQLFDLTKDFSQSTDVAAGHPQKLAQMKVLFDREATRNDVYPLMGGADQTAANRPGYLAGKTHLVFYPGTVRLPEGVVPNITLHSHTMTADIGPQSAGARNGILITQGGRFGGYAWYVDNGYLVYSHSYYGLEHSVIRAERPLPSSAVTVKVEFDRTDSRPGSGAAVKLYVNEELVGHGTIPRTAVWRLSLHETLDVGEDSGSAVDDTYSIPYQFSDGLHSVTVDLR